MSIYEYTNDDYIWLLKGNMLVRPSKRHTRFDKEDGSHHPKKWSSPVETSPPWVTQVTIVTWSIINIWSLLESNWLDMLVYPAKPRLTAYGGFLDWEHSQIIHMFIGFLDEKPAKTGCPHDPMEPLQRGGDLPRNASLSGFPGWSALMYRISLRLLEFHDFWLQ